MPTVELSRRSFLFGAGALALSLTRGVRAQEKRKPNFLIILADDMGYSDAGCYGGEVQTPRLDGLAAKGIRFTQVYSTGRCWPSRSCLMTGFYAQQIRMDPPKGKLPAWCRLAPHYLKPEGYRCYHSGKWHIRGANKPCADGGFDHSYRLADHNRFFSPKSHFKDDKPLPPVEPGSGYYTTTAIAEECIGFLKDHAENYKEKPFFQYLAFNCPHFPLHALQKDIDRYRDTYTVGWDAIRAARYARMRKMGLVHCKLSDPMPKVKPSWNLAEDALKKRIGPGEAGYAVPWDTLDADQKKLQATKMAIHAAMIDRMDQEIGRVLDQIEAMGELDNTLVVFLSDNGASAEQIIRGDMHDKTAPLGSGRSYLCLGPGFSTAANTPFRYHKSWNHEGGISSPCIVHWPAGIQAQGELRRNPGHFIDILPTVLEVAGIEPPATWQGKPAPPIQGRSLVPAFTRDGSVEQPFLFFHHTSNRGIRMGDWKLSAAGGKGPWELYNLADDRSETNDLSKKLPEKAKELADAWQKHETDFRTMAKSDTWPLK